MSEVDVYDVLYAPLGQGFAIQVVDFPEHRWDVLEELEVAGVAIWALARRLDLPRHEVAVRVRAVESLPGRDAPLRIEAPSTLEALRRLDEQLEGRDE